MLTKNEMLVMDCYKRKNPSIYYKANIENITKQKIKLEQFFFHKLKFPKENFKDKTLIEFGCGSGQKSIVYNLWGAHTTLVDFEKGSLESAKTLFYKYAKKKNINFSIIQ